MAMCGCADRVSLCVVSGPRHSISVGSGPVVKCVPVMGDLWVACDGTIYLLQKDRKSVKVGHIGYTQKKK